MFKDLKLVKIILFLILAMIIVKSQITDHKNTEFIFNSTSYSKTDSLSFYSISNTPESRVPFVIKNVLTNKTVLDTFISVTKTYDYFDSLDFLLEGYPIKRESVRCLNIKPGIYTSNNKNPFVVSKNSKSDLTVVFPGVNNLFYTPQNGVRVFDADYSDISANLPFSIDDWTKGLTSLFKDVEETHDVNYITDLDLENSVFLENTKLLVLYGRLTFWTPTMINNVERFIQNGGNILVASSDIFYAKFCFDKELKRLKLNFCDGFESTEPSKIQSWNQITNDKNALAMRYAFHSNYGGLNIDRKGAEIVNQNHKIFENINLSELVFALDIGSEYIGTLNVKKNSDAYKNLSLYRMSILAKTYCKRGSKIDNIGGVFEFRKDNGGKAIIIGTSDLCLKESQSKTSVFKLFLNSINYLLDS